MEFLIALLIILLCAFVATYLIGSFFMSIAIIRKKKPSDSFVPDEEKEKKEKKEKDRERIKASKALLDKRAEELLKNTEDLHPEITTPDFLMLRASFFPNDGDRYAILVHGYTGSRKEMMSKAAVFHSWGYSVLVPDNRAHGESDGKYIGMGWLDKDDIGLWTDWIRKRNQGARIVLLGVSMGGAAVMMAAGENFSGVEAVIDDCGYTSVWDIFADELRSLYHLPAFPILEMCRVMIRLKAGYDIKEASSINQLKKTTVPILFIHGSDDNFVKTYMVYKNYDAKANGDKDILIVKDAGHAMAEIENPKQYYGKIEEFLSRYGLS